MSDAMKGKSGSGVTDIAKLEFDTTVTELKNQTNIK